MLDGVRPHNNSQFNSARHAPYVNALKFGVGGNGNPQVPSLEPKFCPQLPRSNPTGLLSVVQPSHHLAQPDTEPPIPLDPHPTNMDELLVCCLIRKI